MELLKAFGISLKRDLSRAIGAITGLVVLGVLFTAISPGFLSGGNLESVATQSTVLVLLAVGQTLVIMSEGIDLSAGPVLTLSGVVAALAMKGGHEALAIPAALLVGAAAGAVNGFLVGVVRMPPFLVTLGTMSIAQGISLVLTKGGSIANLPPWYQQIYQSSFLGIPSPTWISLIVSALFFALLNGTRFGASVIAVGGNRDAARLAGISVVRTEILVYILSGLLAGAAGILMTSRLNAAHPTVGTGLEFDAIAAVIIGGTSFARGNGGIASTLFGVAMIVILRNGMNLRGIDAFWQLPAIGATIILAMAGSTLLEQRRRWRNHT